MPKREAVRRPCTDLRVRYRPDESGTKQERSTSEKTRTRKEEGQRRRDKGQGTGAKAPAEGGALDKKRRCDVRR